MTLTGGAWDVGGSINETRACDMTAMTQPRGGTNWWRVGRWTAAALLLCVPAVAMRLTPEVRWTAVDFVVMAGLFAAILGGYEVLASRASGAAYRVAATLTVLGVFLLIWLNLAVGIIGSEDSPANLMFVAVVAVIVGGACIAKFQPAGMKRAMIAAAVVQVAVGGIALAGDMGSDGRGWPRDVIVLTIFFAGLWLVAGTCYSLAGERR